MPRPFQFRVVCWGFSAVLLLTACPTVFAVQTTAPVSSEAGPEEARFRKRGKGLEPPERVMPPIEDQAPPYLQPPFGPETRKFFVKQIVVEGNVLIPEEDLKRLVSPYEGRELPLADLRRLAGELTQWLRGHEYVTSRVYIPPQEITDGLVKVQVLEGRIGEIRIEGAKYSRPETLTGRMRTKPGGLLRYTVLQRDLAALAANPDRRIMAVLVPGKTTGTTDVVIRLEESRPWHGGYFLHTMGTKLTGRFRQGAIIGHRNLTGHDDQLVIRSEFSERSDFFGIAANYLIPLGATGGTLGVNFGRADIELNRHFRHTNIIGNATVLGVDWAQPIFQTQHWETEWVSGFDAKRVRSQELGVDQGKDDLRILRLGPNVMEQDAWGRSIVTTEVGIGFSQFLGASHKKDSAASRTQSGGQFTRVNLSAGRLQHLPWGFQLLVRGATQLTNDRLSPAETGPLGGEDTVRGYPEGEFLADYGYVGTMELRLPIPVRVAEHNTMLTVVGFADGGAGFLRKPVMGERSKARLIGLGFGGRYAVSPYTNVLMDVGFPVGNGSSAGDNPRLYVAFNIGW